MPNFIGTNYLQIYEKVLNFKNKYIDYMKHLKTMNELFGFLKKKINPDSNKAKEILSKMDSEIYEIFQRIGQRKIEFFLMFKDSEVIIRMTVLHSVFIIEDDQMVKLNITDAEAKEVYLKVAKAYRSKNKERGGLTPRMNASDSVAELLRESIWSSKELR